MADKSFHLSRETTIAAPPERVHALVNDFHEWQAWSPWEGIDPAMERTYTGAPTGVGAVYAWRGNSKAAVRQHSQTVALHCAAQGLAIRCNSLHPGAILTPMWEPLLGSGAARTANMAAMVAETPLRRFGQPAEVAAAAVLLASDEACYITGSDIHIDGGLIAGRIGLPPSLCPPH